MTSVAATSMITVQMRGCFMCILPRETRPCGRSRMPDDTARLSGQASNPACYCPFMHFGIFIEEARRGSSAEQWFKETFDLVDLSEAWELDGVWLGEIHFNPVRSVLSSPFSLAGFIAGRTR